MEHATAHPDEAVLFVVAGIEVAQVDDGLVGGGGEVTMLDPWQPQERGELKPIAYRHTLP